MILYHGSNIEVTKPQIIVSNRALDFGAGFYTTSSEDQAIRWAKLQALRRGKGIPTVSAYEFDDAKASQLFLSMNLTMRRQLRSPCCVFHPQMGIGSDM